MRYIFILMTTLLISGCSQAYVEPIHKKLSAELNAVDANDHYIIDRGSKEYKEKSEALKYNKKEWDSSVIEYEKDQKGLNHAKEAGYKINNALEQYKN